MGSLLGGAQRQIVERPANLRPARKQQSAAAFGIQIFQLRYQQRRIVGRRRIGVGRIGVIRIAEAGIFRLPFAVFLRRFPAISVVPASFQPCHAAAVQHQLLQFFGRKRGAAHIFTPAEIVRPLRPYFGMFDAVVA